MTKKMYEIVPGDFGECPAPPEYCLDCEFSEKCVEAYDRELREWEAEHPEDVIEIDPVKKKQMLEMCLAIIDEAAAKRRAAEADGVEDC